MTKFRRVVLTAALVAGAQIAGVVRGHAQLEGIAPDARPKDHPVPAIQDTETAAQRDARMAWFREARFGMFIHWGLYSIPAGVWDVKHCVAVRPVRTL